MIVSAHRLLRSVARAWLRQSRVTGGRVPLVHARGQIRPFSLDQPPTIRAAAAGLARTLDARVMAGGIDLINEMKLGSEIGHVVSLAKIPVLHGISLTNDHLIVGAATSHAEIERDPTVATLFPQVPAIVREVGNVRVRAVGTIGGNLMAGNRYYDWLPVLMALSAEVSFAGAHPAWRSIDVLTKRSTTWHLPKRILTAIRIPLWGNPRLRFNRDLKPAISIAVCVRRGPRGDTARVGVGCLRAVPIGRELEGFGEVGNIAYALRLRAADGPVHDRPRLDAIAEAIGARAAAALPPPDDDGLAGSDYRRAMARTLIVRTLREVMEDR